MYACEQASKSAGRIFIHLPHFLPLRHIQASKRVSEQIMLNTYSSTFRTFFPSETSVLLLPFPTASPPLTPPSTLLLSERTLSTPLPSPIASSAGIVTLSGSVSPDAAKSGTLVFVAAVTVPLVASVIVVGAGMEGSDAVDLCLLRDLRRLFSVLPSFSVLTVCCKPVWQHSEVVKIISVRVCRGV